MQQTPTLLSAYLHFNLFRAHKEFRRHQKADNPLHIIGFLSQWKMYLDQLPAGPDGAKAFRGKPLDPTTLEKVRSVDGHRFIAIDVLCSP